MFKKLIVILYLRLNNLYQSWLDNFIEQWGYEEYEDTYCFPNYDYDYFDNLDIKWYEEESSEDELDDYY